MPRQWYYCHVRGEVENAASSSPEAVVEALLVQELYEPHSGLERRLVIIFRKVVERLGQMYANLLC